MKKLNLTVTLTALALLVLVIPIVAAARTGDQHEGSTGAVYIMTNSVTGNQVVAYNRAGDGSLTLAGTFPTTGLGTGSGLGNQGGLALSEDARMLLVVNAGSNEISVFHVNPNGLTLTGKVSSNGAMPISITVHDELVYVLDTGGASNIGNIAGFRLSDEGRLSSIPGSVQPLSGATGPAQISFNPNGEILVVTEKTTNIIDSYTVNDNGVAKGPMTYSSNGATPFGFAFDKRGQLIVSEAAGGPLSTSALSSYKVSESGSLKTISGSVPDAQKAACWVAVTGNGKFAYTTNTASNSISSYTVHRNGSITLLHSIASTTDGGPLDMALSRNSTFLYVATSGGHTIEGFRVHPDGSLTLIVTVTGVPVGADGLAAN